MSARVPASTSGTLPDSSAALSPASPPTLASLTTELTTRPARGPWSIALGRFRRSKLAVLGVIVITAITLAAIFADVLAPYGENEIDLFNITEPPSSEHMLGTDELGRDELSRLFYGGRISLAVGLSAAMIATILGILVGALAGYYGGWVDVLLMRFVDPMLAFPAIFLLLILFAMYGSSVLSVVIFVGAFSWMWLARHPRRVHVAQRT